MSRMSTALICGSLSLLALPLTGCALDAPAASGPYRALNRTRWQPTPDDLTGSRANAPFANNPGAATTPQDAP